DPSPTPGVRYRLYYGPNSGQQTIFEDTGTSTTWEVKDLPPGVPIYFVARAYIGVSESGPSSEVVYTQPAPTPPPAPTPTPAPTPAPTPSPTPSAGFVTREVWRNVSG